MQADTVVEVVVRFAGELHDVAYLHAGTYRAGVCDIVIAEVRDQLARASSPLVIERRLVRITLCLCEPSRIPVPRKRFERRPFVYGIGSLAAHLAVCVAAIGFASAELAIPSVAGESKGRRARISSSFASAAQTVKHAPKPEPSETPVTTDATPSAVPATDDEESGGPEQHTGGSPEVDRTGDVAAEPPSTEAGRARRFDPDASPEFDTVKVGNFSTVSTGRLSGEHYGTEGKRTGLIVVSCDSKSCIVLGGENAAPIRNVVEQHLAEITACYEHEQSAAGRKIEIDFGVDAEGKVDGLQVSGVGDVGNCVAEIIKRTSFDADA